MLLRFASPYVLSLSSFPSHHLRSPCSPVVGLCIQRSTLRNAQLVYGLPYDRTQDCLVWVRNMIMHDEITMPPCPFSVLSIRGAECWGGGKRAPAIGCAAPPRLIRCNMGTDWASCCADRLPCSSLRGYGEGGVKMGEGSVDVDDVPGEGYWVGSGEEAHSQGGRLHSFLDYCVR